MNFLLKNFWFLAKIALAGVLYNLLLVVPVVDFPRWGLKAVPLNPGAVLAFCIIVFFWSNLLKNFWVRSVLVSFLFSPFIYAQLANLAKLIPLTLTAQNTWLLKSASFTVSFALLNLSLWLGRIILFKTAYALFWPFRVILNNQRLRKFWHRLKGMPECKINLSMPQIDALGNGDTYLKGQEFEKFVANIYRTLGYEANTTTELRALGLLPPSIQKRGGSGEQGVDVIVPIPQPDGTVKRLIIQCKHYSQKVDNSAVQQIVAAMPIYQGDQAAVITNQTFTAPAAELAMANGVILIDRQRLPELIQNAVRKHQQLHKKAA